MSFHEIGSIANESLSFAVIGARYGGRWVFVQHRERQTWEIPGGHREPGETIEQAAFRELMEETGAVDFELNAICEYSVTRGEQVSYGRLFLATVYELGPLPNLEIGRVELYESLPGELTYPLIQPFLQERLEQRIQVRI